MCCRIRLILIFSCLFMRSCYTSKIEAAALRNMENTGDMRYKVGSISSDFAKEKVHQPFLFVFLNLTLNSFLVPRP